MKLIGRLCFFVFFFSSLYSQNGDKGKISGEAFIDYFYNISRDTVHSKLPNTALKEVQDFNAFEFRRVTFTYDYDFSSIFQSRVRFEANQSSSTGNSVTPYIKDLFLKWKNIFDGSDLIFGIQPPPSFEVSESYWQFRSLEKTIMDLRNIASSRDMGLALKGKLDNEGFLSYWVTFANNSNLGPEIDKYKRVYLHLNITPMKDMNITLYSDYKFRTKISQLNSSNQSVVSLNNDVITSVAFIGIRDEDFSCGIEGILQMSRNGYSISNANQTSYSTLNGFGLSVFGNYQIIENINLLGRFDYYDPNSKVDFDSRNFIVLGLSFLAEKNIRIIPNVLLETYQNNSTTAFESSITGRLTVHFVY
ncbi:MAG: hypothetical protein A2315_00935 [Ignavibacteria bacterium RIFOXYB2_FULL_35_12]|nr:MAG: hypothetical protein A2058_16550 [Ignavibacteria bacterium GWA2_36_19]OGU54037.1 MAG: hypothetical protein A2006_00320 [Ignavibacteria bacterium GWC2_35_8]OGU62223.1 MAG: hypothetical protein A2X60_04235 [Ignavibacteria bacterium GWF2_35_20]OGU82479.1 MAG: hypothetical protein A2254_10845 [Ignavibacteria bacterium RIFOXYA2_FULL_35_9]OGU84629.1 MAG: hypothetical protein A3K31_09365 [Ignavibacteria bacterium RIFOXYA12_FULL_35_25]OGU96899.1 MAG: hypothetical protein A2347_14730 [Ignavibac